MTNGGKYICHCNNCGDEFWIDKKDAADVIECPTCKKTTPLIVKATAYPEPDTICTCEEFKKVLEDGSGDGCAECQDETELIVICKKLGKAYYYLGTVAPPINFCPWCGKKVKSDEH